MATLEVVENVVRFVTNFHNHHNTRLLHVLGLLLAVSGIFRFYLDFQPLTSFILLVFNWTICIVLEAAAVEIAFQIPWNSLRLQNVTALRYFMFFFIFAMGRINVYSMWQLCMAVYNCVSDNPEHGWIATVPPWLTIFTAMCQCVVLEVCVPVQIVIISLNCNKDIPNVNFSSHVTLAVNFWLFVHFVYLSVNYSYYDIVALFYRSCCTVWMLLYSYPDQALSIYCWFKQHLPDCTKPFLRFVRDQLITRVWRDISLVIEWRRKEGNVLTIDVNPFNMLNNLWMALCNKTTFLLLFVHMIICILVSYLLQYYTGWNLALMEPMLIFILYLMLHRNYPENHQPSGDTSNSCEEQEKFEIQLPIQCTDHEELFF